VRDTLAKLGIPRATFCRRYDRHRQGGSNAVADRVPRAERVWNRIAQAVHDTIIPLALDEPAPSPREVAARFTGTRGCLISEASVYRLLKAQGPVTGPAFIVIKAADAFRDKTTATNQLRQTDFTCLKVIGWSWFCLSSVLDDFSRCIVAWKLCPGMRAEDVTAMLDPALRAGGVDGTTPADRPRLLSDNGSSDIAGDVARWLEDRKIKHGRGAPCHPMTQDHPMTQGKIERWHRTPKSRILLENYFLPGDLETRLAAFRLLQQPPILREYP
jgi:transposase InsO family protein